MIGQSGIECRTITEDEAARFLHVMCEVFDLDPSRASQIFYSEPFYDLSRKWALFVGGEIVSVLTLSPLKFGWGRAVGIAGVGTLRPRQGQGFASRLIHAALAHCESQGERTAYLFATKPTVYARLGFTVLDEVVSGEVTPMEDPGEPILMDFEEIRAAYDQWSEADPNRLRRDDQRWNAWQWVYRPCEKLEGGYVCNEPMLCREALLLAPTPALPVVDGTRWTGLRSLTKAMGVPATRFQHELLLMGRNSPGTPQMFMTDQF